MGDLGTRGPVEGVLTADNKFGPGTPLWVVTFTPRILSATPDFEVWHASVFGPGGYFLMFRDDSLFSVGQNGLINVYDPNTAMYARDGQTISLHWSIGSGRAPKVWLYLREPEVG